VKKRMLKKGLIYTLRLPRHFSKSTIYQMVHGTRISYQNLLSHAISYHY